MQVARQRALRQRGVDRALVVRVMIAGNHHHPHLRAPDLLQRELERPFADPARIEQIADDQ